MCTFENSFVYQKDKKFWTYLSSENQEQLFAPMLDTLPNIITDVLTYSHVEVHQEQVRL